MNNDLAIPGSIIDAVDTSGRRIGFWRCVSAEDRGVWNYHEVQQREGAEDAS